MQIAIPSSQAIRRKAVRCSRVGPRICVDAMVHGGKFFAFNLQRRQDGRLIIKGNILLLQGIGVAATISILAFYI
jgi:hypothetical protein